MAEAILGARSNIYSGTVGIPLVLTDMNCDIVCDLLGGAGLGDVGWKYQPEMSSVCCESDLETIVTNTLHSVSDNIKANMSKYHFPNNEKERSNQIQYILSDLTSFKKVHLTVDRLKIPFFEPD